MTIGLDNLKVGDRLMLKTGDRYRADEPVTVTRIGRKYLYVAATSDGREKREHFNRASGVEVTRSGHPARLYTQEQYDDLAQRQSIFTALLGAGIEIQDRVRPSMSTDTLRALLAVVKP